MQKNDPKMIEIVANTYKSNPKRLMLFLYECDKKKVRISTPLMEKLVGDIKTNQAQKVVDECFAMINSPEREKGLDILFMMNNGEGKEIKHNKENRTNSSASIRIVPAGAWGLEYHKTEYGTPPYRACEKYDELLRAGAYNNSSVNSNHKQSDDEPAKKSVRRFS